MIYRCLVILLVFIPLPSSLVAAQLVNKGCHVVWPTELSCVEGSQIFCEFEAAYSNAINEKKPGIIVFFSEYQTEKFASLTNGSFSLPKAISCGFNVVVLCPGLISPLDFPYKMDPVIVYMGNFIEKFPEVSTVEGPRLCYILLDEQGTARCQAILPLGTN
ncbi:hypothetical protein C10C_0915 [Chlamydia serpentis]|uniref:Uncharacterized protein n=1 Tax=Chlamydia serpentis TaxID=1967782 RepID=A0A2R8FCI7_9CHLA|nr:hypothetical protein [Chlamydia serpentis]SPN74052.1 hypothetical protein C10C_0915 [Chlamydia serpentis]